MLDWHEAKTPAERIARFNGCKDAFVVRDVFEGEETLSWIVMHGNVETLCGWTDRSFTTLREARDYMVRAYPDMPHWRAFISRVEGNKPARRLPQRG